MQTETTFFQSSPHTPRRNSFPNPSKPKLSTRKVLPNFPNQNKLQLTHEHKILKASKRKPQLKITLSPQLLNKESASSRGFQIKKNSPYLYKSTPSTEPHTLNITKNTASLHYNTTIDLQTLTTSQHTPKREFPNRQNFIIPNRQKQSESHAMILTASAHIYLNSSASQTTKTESPDPNPSADRL